MAQVAEILPLYSNADYFYITVLDGVAYKIRLYYNERMKKWAIDLRYADNTPIVLGESLVRNYPIFLDYQIEGMNGFFYFEEIGKDMNETNNHHFEIWKYFRLYYIYDDGE